MLWKELIKIALVGTDRITVSKSVLENLKQIGVPENKDIAKMILEGAAIQSMMRKAGSTLNTWTEPLPDSKRSDGGEICNRRSSAHLKAILFGSHKKALPEFIKHLTQNQKNLPPELLPELLDEAVVNEKFSALRLSCIGSRGAWLIQQNDEWKNLNKIIGIDEWDTAKRDERLALFQHLRLHKPDEARKLLEKNWKEESVKSKQTFLELFNIGLQNNDEPFLESGLDEGRKENRKLAAELLSKIPKSRFNQRMEKRIKSYVQFKPSNKEKLKITLPENFDEAMIRDSIDPSLKWFKEGLKASRLGQMIVLLPPEKWIKILQQSPSEIIKLFIRSEYSTLLIQALIVSCKLHKNEDWRSLLLHFWLDNHEKKRWQNIEAQDLISDCSNDVYNELAIKSICDLAFLPEEQSPADILLKSQNHNWSDELSLLFVSKLRKWILQEQSRWSGWHIRKILKQAAYQINPDLTASLSRGWPRDAPVWSGWQKDIETFLSILHFRKMMIEALAS